MASPFALSAHGPKVNPMNPCHCIDKHLNIELLTKLVVFLEPPQILQLELPPINYFFNLGKTLQINILLINHNRIMRNEGHRTRVLVRGTIR